MNRRHNICLVTALALWIVAFCGCAANSSITEHDKILPDNSQGEDKMQFPNYESCTESPQFADDQIGIRVSFAGAKQQIAFGANDVWPVFGTYRVGKETIDEFGTDIAGNIVVIATHKESRAIFTGRVVKDFMPAPSGPPPSAIGGIEVTNRTSYFNFDLKAQCRIPPQPGKYWVVVFVGRLASNALEFELR